MVTLGYVFIFIFLNILFYRCIYQGSFIFKNKLDEA